MVGVKCNIEIQLSPETYEKERILYYWADTYSRQINRGNQYGDLKKTISIVILDHEIEELKEIEKLGVKWQIRDNETGKRVLTDRLEIVILELPKAKRIYEKDNRNKVGQWMMFLDNPNNKEVVQIMNSNKEIEKAFEELEQVSGNEKLRRIAELKIKGIRDRYDQLDYAKKQGIEQGILVVAKELLKRGISVDEVSDITGLEKSKIEKL